MAFSFNNGGGSSAAPAPNTDASAQTSDELREIHTDQLGFQPIGGDCKLQLLPAPWPTDALPHPSSSLLAVASSKGLVVAAAPSELIIASTTSIRNAWASGEKPENNVKAFNPEVKITVPRLSHLAFSADENVLVIAGESSGGLAAYTTDALTQGQITPALQVSTNNKALRALAPNPNVQFAELFAAVTADGELLIADLKSGQLRNGTDGPVLKTGVSCLSWSNQGKQLVAGLADGTVVQMTPDGTTKAEIPRPPSLEGDKHVSTLSWLSNDTFLIIYSSNSNSDDMAQPSDFFIITRQPRTQNYTFHPLPEVCPAFGLNRSPACQFVARLRKFEPHIEDLLLIASTTSFELGLVTKADAPLSHEDPVTDSYTLAMPADDSRRAQLPLSLREGDTSPIGVALDLSAKDSVVGPVPSDPEIEQSSGPLPNIFVLNHEGVLASWWVVYADSIREKKTYSGLVASGGPEQTQKQATPIPTQAVPSPSSGFGQPALGLSESGQLDPPTQPSFARPATSTFGGGSDAKFGSPSALSGDKPAWTSTGFTGASSQSGSSGFGQHAFGAPSPFAGKPAFGQPALSASTPDSGTAFGQQGALGAKNPNPFSGSGAASPFGGSVGGAKGFASIPNTGGFSALSGTQTGQDRFFGKAANKDSAFAQTEHPSPFAPKIDGPHNNSAFSDFGGNDFSVSSTFKPDETAKNGMSESDDVGGLSFESGLGDALEQTQEEPPPAQSKEEEMDEGGADPASTTPSQEEPAQLVPDFKPQEMDEGGADPALTAPSQEEPAQLSPDASTAPSQEEPAQLPPDASTAPRQEEPAQLSPDPKPQEMDEGGADSALTTPSQEEPAHLPPHPKPQVAVVTPPSTISQPKPTPAPPVAGLFSTDSQTGTTPAAVQNSKPGWSPQPGSSTTPKETPNTKPSPLPASPNDDDQSPKIKTEAPSEGSSLDLRDIPEAPLPPDPTSKSLYPLGDTPDTSDESKHSNDDAPLPSNGSPKMNDSAFDASQTDPGPADDDDDDDNDDDDEGDDFSSDFEGSVEDETHEISPIEEPTGDQAEQIHTSPESSFGKGAEGSEETSPTGGLFTKVSTSKPSRLFGEVTAGPVLPPPVPQESPRSPSPVRNVVTADLLRSEPSRSVSAPTRPHSTSALDRRRAELTKSALASQPINACDVKEKETERKSAGEKAKAKAEAEAEAEATTCLEDDEDARLRAELEAPPSPSEHLEPFVPHQHNGMDTSNKSGIPGQIERLYQDINSMIDTLGINAHSLSAYILYQTSQEPYKAWPEILNSETPRDALNDEWVLHDITRLGDGEQTLRALLGKSRIDHVVDKFDQCQELLNQDVVQLRMHLSSTRKTLHASADAPGRVSAPLSAEQASLQHDLRKASMSLQSKLVEAEQELTILRAKLAEARPAAENGRNGTGKGMLGRSAPQKKPTVEAVTSTIAKMTSMAEKKSTDIDVLEAQLKNLGLSSNGSVGGSRQASVEPSGTPQRGSNGLGMSLLGRTSMGATGSVYHTPDSRFGESNRGTPGTWRSTLRANVDGNGALVSTEDSERWREKARRKKEVHRLLAEALAERRKTARTAKA